MPYIYNYIIPRLAIIIQPELFLPHSPTLQLPWCVFCYLNSVHA